MNIQDFSSPDFANRTALTETILLAEDEPMVLEYSRRILENAGYTVVTARDGDEAWQGFLQNRDQISLAVLDMVMPKQSGYQVYCRIKEEAPGKRVHPGDARARLAK